MSDPGNTNGCLWARMRDWVLVDAGLANVVSGSLLGGTGLRVRGAVETPERGLRKQGFGRRERTTTYTSGSVHYLITGSVVAASDYEVGEGRSAMTHGGVDLVMNVDGVQVQAQVDGLARDFVLGSLLSVTGELSVIPYYEWDDFGLADTRGTWRIEETQQSADGDLRVCCTNR